jgi:hypothetical protein
MKIENRKMTISKPTKPFLLLAATLIAVTPMAADKPVTTDVPMDITDMDFCSGEEVHLSGVAEVSMSVTIDSNSAHIVGLVNEHLEGSGLSTGATYIADAMAHVDSNADIDPVTNTGEATILISARINAQGSIPNTSEQQLVHVTINANGTTTSTVNHIKIVCQ